MKLIYLQLVFLFLTKISWSQNRLPECSNQNLLYYISTTGIYEYDVSNNSQSLAYLGTPSHGYALAIGPVLNSNNPLINTIPTYHLLIGLFHAYVDPVSLQIVTTTHQSIGANLSYGNKYIFNYNGFNAVSRYDGINQPVAFPIITFASGETSIMPAIIADCDDNYYLLTNQGLNKYDSNGVYISRSTYALGTRQPASGGGMAMTNDTLYTINGPNIQVFWRNPNNTLVFVRTITGLGRSGYDMSNCKGIPLQDINLSISNTENCENNFTVYLNNPNTANVINKVWTINGNVFTPPNSNPFNWNFTPNDSILTVKYTYESICGTGDRVDTIRIPIHKNVIYYDTIVKCDYFDTLGYRINSDTTIFTSFQNAHGCDSLLSYLHVRILKLQTQYIDTVICEGDSIYLADRWINKVANWTVYYKNINNCDSVVTYNVDIIPKPIVIIEGLDKDTVCIGTDIALFLKSNHTAFWHYGSNDVNINPRINAGANVFYYTAEGHNVCKLNDSVAVYGENCCYLFIPNAFSPNGDGLNDLFGPNEGLESSFGYSLMIYNRWGEMMFKGSNPNDHWDGTYKGKMLDVGVYFYNLTYKCDGKSHHQKGEVHLIR